MKNKKPKCSQCFGLGKPMVFGSTNKGCPVCGKTRKVGAGLIGNSKLGGELR